MSSLKSELAPSPLCERADSSSVVFLSHLI